MGSAQGGGLLSCTGADFLVTGFRRMGNRVRENRRIGNAAKQESVHQPYTICDKVDVCWRAAKKVRKEVQLLSSTSEIHRHPAPWHKPGHKAWHHPHVDLEGCMTKLHFRDSLGFISLWQCLSY
jgi:hypothetical protein